MFPIKAITTCFDSVQETLQPLKKRKDFKFYPPEILSNFTMAQTKGNVLTLTFDLRLLPGQSMQRIFKILVKKLNSKFRNMKTCRISIRIERYNPPLGLHLRRPFVKLTRKILKKNGFKPQFITKPSCTDAGLFQTVGIPA
jgi:acetylornithine deacetylase/succinyl-diaminopimelate desuccinylase-like protein